jgi:hypothetical protein
MLHDLFRIAIVVSPVRLVSIGVLSGDYGTASEWLLANRPLIDDFLSKLREGTNQTRQKARALPRLRPVQAGPDMAALGQPTP